MKPFEWKLAFAHARDCRGRQISCIADIDASGFDTVPAAVPGNFELDLVRAGKLADPYFSTNTLALQALEDVHLWYYTTFSLDRADQKLHFGGIDTFADIYVNGALTATTDNMFLPCDVAKYLRVGENELVVHIRPTMQEARRYDIPALCFALPYNYSSLYIRKAAHMFGWDIMPRIVSGGLWKPVTLEPLRADALREVYFCTSSIDRERRMAHMRVCLNATLSGDFCTEYSVRVHGACGDSRFDVRQVLWNHGYQFNFDIPDCRLWWPKNYGAPDLYDTVVELWRGEELCDRRKLSVGVRTVELVLSDSTPERVGDFCFCVNGKRIFVLGTNWVPLDAFHSRDEERLDRALALLDDLGCNAVRCWGGNVYESDRFYDFCDRHGILVWQDFAMGCAAYPEDEEFLARLVREVTYQIKRLRNHPSLALFAGDNECDGARRQWSGFLRDPNENRITRELLPRLVRTHGFTVPYLPSSPYISEHAHKSGLPLPENHLWGPRDDFKGKYYRGAVCRFASETGYQGIPSPASLRRFLAHPETIFEEGTATPTAEYIVHAASPEARPDAKYAYRIGLTVRQIATLFGKVEDNFDDLLRQSQISQAEALKYFIEKFRLRKGECTGIIWWNLLDGWPQVSDAIVDYYFCKKLAYHYVRRSQAPVCLMFDEPTDGALTLYAVNDLGRDVTLHFTLTEVFSDTPVASGTVTARADASLPVLRLPAPGEGVRKFYRIEWTDDEGARGFNHFATALRGSDYAAYYAALRACGMDEFEGFGDSDDCADRI